MPDSSRSLLEVEGLVSGYRKKQVLNGVSIEVMEGEIVALTATMAQANRRCSRLYSASFPPGKGR